MSDDEIRYLARGELPPGVDPDSADGRRYRLILDEAERRVAAAAPMDEVTRHRVWRLLQGLG